MQTIGFLLKEIRDNLTLQLNEVQLNTNISICELLSIENGSNIPTINQLSELSQLYCEKTQKKAISEIKDDFTTHYRLNELSLAIEQLMKEKSALFQYNLFPTIIKSQHRNFINLENRRYIGSKIKLASWIIELILSETKGVNSFFDVFAGTAAVSKVASEHFNKIIINDILHSNNLIYKAFFKKDLWDICKLEDILYQYNTLDPNKLTENYFSTNFGDKYFDRNSAKMIGYIREDIENRKNKLTEKEYAILIASLIYNIDKIANTVGHYDAYIKKSITPKKLIFKLIKPTDVDDIEIFQEDANKLVKVLKADIAYIDPPYNSRQYNRFYHIYENLVKWNKPELYGVALKPKPENNSVYCTVKAESAFQNLIENLNVKYIAVSYNNTYNSKSNSSKNKISLENIEKILSVKGRTKVFECSHKYFNAGKTDFVNHKEFLFITSVNDR